MISRHRQRSVTDNIEEIIVVTRLVHPVLMCCCKKKDKDKIKLFREKVQKPIPSLFQNFPPHRTWRTSVKVVDLNWQMETHFTSLVLIPIIHWSPTAKLIKVATTSANHQCRWSNKQWEYQCITTPRQLLWYLLILF